MSQPDKGLHAEHRRPSLDRVCGAKQSVKSFRIATSALESKKTYLKRVQMFVTLLTELLANPCGNIRRKRIERIQAGQIRHQLFGWLQSTYSDRTVWRSSRWRRRSAPAP